MHENDAVAFALLEIGRRHEKPDIQARHRQQGRQQPQPRQHLSGQHVEAGQALYRIDTRSYASALAAAQASAAQASATYENAKKDLARYEQLVSSGAISKQAYDGQKSSTEAYRAVYEAAQAQVQIASDNLGDTIVTAPFSGTLSMDDVNIGTFATAEIGRAHV